MVRASSTADIVDQPASGSPTSTATDGWGEVENGIFEEDHENEKDGWDDFKPLEEDTNSSPALASIQAAQKRPVIHTKPQGNNIPELSVLMKSHSYVFAFDCNRKLKANLAFPFW